MTSTPIKDVGSILANLTPAAGAKNAALGAAQTGFQTVLDNQAQRNLDNQAPDKAVAKQPAEKQPSAGKKPAEQPSQVNRKDSTDSGDAGKTESAGDMGIAEKNGGEELTPEELEEVMAVLGTAAAELIQKTAELLGISVEEVQGIMADLGMGELDVLDPAQLGELFLQAGGVEDPYALVTDEKLYGDYQELMGQLETTLQECGARLALDTAQMEPFLAKLKEQASAQKDVPPAEVSQLQQEAITESRPEGMGEIPLQAAAEADAPKDAPENHKGQGHKESSPDNREQGGNFFIQNLKTDDFRPEVQQTAEAVRTAEADTENIMRQIMDYMKIQLKADTTNLEMQLHPASLGTVQVQIASRGGAVTANFIAQNETVKAALESQMVQLIERFEEQGVKVEAIEVTVQTHEFERNLEQGRGRDQQGDEPAKKGRTRRINLNDALSMEDLAEEDALAADMMAASGNTVDYTA